MTKKRSNLLVKLAIGAVVLALFGFLFVRSLETTRADPYTLDQSQLQGWTLELDPSAGPNAPLLELKSRTDLVSNLFRQVFQRTMESMTSPQAGSIPIVLRGEFDRGLAPAMKPEELLSAARAAGLESAAHEPRCLAHRRSSEGRNVQQIYFAVVDSPSIVAFRQTLARSAAGFEAGALTPVLVVASAGRSHEQWFPISARDEECVAPITIQR